MKKGQTELVDQLNKALNDMEKDGTYTKIYKKWFNEEPPAEYTK